MWHQIVVGSALVIATTLAHGAGTVVAMRVLSRIGHVYRTYIGRGLVISLLVLVMFLVSVADAMLWAYAYVQVGAISDPETAMYFSMVTFTTLGYGDVTLGTDWRLLASFEAANGTIMFGWTTALVVAYMQRMIATLQGQHDADHA
jgi:hypothetical protein